MTIDIRSTRPDEYRAAADVLSVALLGARPDDEAWQRSLPSWDESRSFSAWDGEQCVGHACHFAVATTVPGGARLPTGAVSRVGVLPTHRRRGVASRLMGMILDDAREQQMALLSLRASEAVIYERYGYGVAGEFCAVSIDPARMTPLRGAAPGGSFRILQPSEIMTVIPPLYDRVAHRRPGVVTRPPSWSTRYFHEAVEAKTASVVAVHLDARREPDGYVHYTTSWTEGPQVVTTGTGNVEDLFAVSDQVELALWQYLFDLDLVTCWTSAERPVDDLVKLAARDPRGYQQSGVQDEQWLRLVDVDAALGGRSYHPAGGAVVVGVVDPDVAANNGNWRITADGAERTTVAADLRTGIAAVSAAYLGGVSWRALAAVGAADADDAALEMADTLFAGRPLPFCGSFF
ncbi:MAG TPA: GNAT family N-acetyltransferase [Ilumatobacter sp.]